jgi:hypothetical protein
MVLYRTFSPRKFALNVRSSVHGQRGGTGFYFHFGFFSYVLHVSRPIPNIVRTRTIRAHLQFIISRYDDTLSCCAEQHVAVIYYDPINLSKHQRCSMRSSTSFRETSKQASTSIATSISTKHKTFWIWTDCEGTSFRLDGNDDRVTG